MNFKPNESRSIISVINVIPLIGVLAALVVVMMVSVPKENADTHSFPAIDGWAPPGEPHTIDIKSNGLLNVDGKEIPFPAISTLPWVLHSRQRRVEIALSADDGATYQEFTDIRSQLRDAGIPDNDIALIESPWSRH